MEQPPNQSSFDVARPEDARPVLFLHCAAWTRRFWLPQTQVISQQYRTIAPDLPGHGALADRPFTLDSAVAEAESLLEKETGGRAVVVGLSMGGYVATELARRRPEMVAGLLLSGCSVDSSGTWSLFLASLHQRFLKLWGKEWLPKTQEKTMRQSFPPEIADPQIQAGFFFKAYGQALLQLHDRGFHRKLQSYPGPVLILNGELDLPNRKSERAQLAACQNGKLLIVPTSDQLCNLRQPYAFNNALLDFLSTVDW